MTIRLLPVLLVMVAVFVAAAAETDVSKKTWVAVHDFTISPDLAKKGISGWSIAEEMENKLTQSEIGRAHV